ncbi:MAG: hypothetical protein QXI16_04830, partial [Sulfolobaceae archaeon]
DNWAGNIWQYINAWVNYISPQYPIQGSDMLETSPYNIKGNCLVVGYDHSFTTITSSHLFFGVYPTELPNPGYSLDVAIREFDVTFRVDRMFFGPQLQSLVMQSSIFGIGGTIPQLIAGAQNPSTSVPQTDSNGNSLLSNILNSSNQSMLSMVSQYLPSSITTALNSLVNPVTAALNVSSSVPSFPSVSSSSNLVSQSTISSLSDLTQPMNLIPFNSSITF